MRRELITLGAVVVLAIAQAGFAWETRDLDPKRDYLAPPPGAVAREALSFGDPQFLYRLFALDVQNAGDTGGRIVPVKNYDFARVVGWLDTLGAMDPRSNFAIGMANGFFGLSQDVGNVPAIVKFMQRNADAAPERRWHWLYGAIYLARHRAKDEALALDVARQLAGYDFEGIEPWASLMPAFILEDEGRFREAREVVEESRRRFGPRMNADDAQWTESYVRFLLQVEEGRIPPRRKSWQ